LKFCSELILSVIITVPSPVIVFPDKYADKPSNVVPVATTIPCDILAASDTINLNAPLKLDAEPGNLALDVNVAFALKITLILVVVILFNNAPNVECIARTFTVPVPLSVLPVK